MHPLPSGRGIVGILLRELKRKLSPESLAIHQQALDLYDRVQRQQQSDTGKIYGLYELEVFSIDKSKAHKKFEFGAKASVTVTKTSGIIVGALSCLAIPSTSTRCLRFWLKSKAS